MTKQQTLVEDLVAALERAAQGYRNILELNLLPEQYRPDTETYIRRMDAVLTRAREEGNHP